MATIQWSELKAARNAFAFARIKGIRDASMAAEFYTEPY